MIKVSIDRQVMQSVMSGVADQLKSKIDLNLKHVKKLCKERYGIKTINGFEHKGGNIAIFNGQIACKLDFEVRFPMSVLITTKDDINSNLPENEKMGAEMDAIPDELDEMLGEELNEIPEEPDDISEEFDALLDEDLDYLLAEELDDIPDELDDIDKSVKLQLIKKDKKKPKKNL